MLHLQQGGELSGATAHFRAALAASRSFPELHDATACRLVAVAHQAALDALAAPPHTAR